MILSMLTISAPGAIFLCAINNQLGAGSQDGLDTFRSLTFQGHFPCFQGMFTTMGQGNDHLSLIVYDFKGDINLITCFQEQINGFLKKLLQTGFLTDNLGDIFDAYQKIMKIIDLLFILFPKGDILYDA